MTVRDRLAQLLREAPADADAIEFEGRWWSWGRLQEAAADVDRTLGAAGIGAAGRVGVVLENRPEIAAAVLAILSSGRCLVTMSPLQPPDRLAGDITRATVPVLIATPEVLDRPGVQDAAAAGGLVLRLDDEGTLTPVAGAVPPDAEPNPGVSVEMLTSGTTGPPKRVRLTDRQMDVAMVSSGQLPREGQLLRGGGYRRPGRGPFQPRPLCFGA